MFQSVFYLSFVIVVCPIIAVVVCAVIGMCIEYPKPHWYEEKRKIERLFSIYEGEDKPHLESYVAEFGVVCDGLDTCIEDHRVGSLVYLRLAFRLLVLTCKLFPLFETDFDE